MTGLAVFATVRVDVLISSFLGPREEERVPETWLRVVLYDLRDAFYDHFDTALTYMRANIDYYAGVLEKQLGFSAACWGVDLDDGKVAAVSHWDSLAAITAARAELERLQADAEVHGIHRVHVQNIQLFPTPAQVPMETGVGDETWLRLVNYKVCSDDEGAREYMSRSVQDFLRVLEEQPGFQRGCWGRDEAADTMAAVTYWNSRWAIVAAGPALRRLQVEATARGVRPVDLRNIHLFAATSAASHFGGPRRA